MSKMIQIRNVPDKLHRELKQRAAKQGKSMSDFLKDMAERELAKPDIEEFLARVRSIPPDTSGFDATAYIRLERDSR
jgi:antitoxin FitA